MSKGKTAQARAGAIAPNDSVYQHKGNIPSPRFLYVHYVDRLRPPYPTYLFEHPAPISNIQQAVEAAVGEILAGKKALPVLPDGSVVWDRASYAAFVMTPSQGRLTKGDGVRIWHETTRRNHSFFNGDDLADVHGCSAMYCVNFRRNINNGPLGPQDAERFIWLANHSHTFISFLHNFFFIHENSGTNTGP
ncbi:MAG TPA: hypothetical protein VHM92_13775 [Allosphingosinicella sp.]|nr:hypothetical protein [Allosphingosinicella sp.]